jgi:hypothetical protein
MRKSGRRLGSDSALLATPATENRQATHRDILTLAAVPALEPFAVHAFACLFVLGHASRLAETAACSFLRAARLVAAFRFFVLDARL